MRQRGMARLVAGDAAQGVSYHRVDRGARLVVRQQRAEGLPHATLGLVLQRDLLDGARTRRRHRQRQRPTTMATGQGAAQTSVARLVARGDGGPVAQ
jgi:hypothetical protein